MPGTVKYFEVYVKMRCHEVDRVEVNALLGKIRELCLSTESGDFVEDRSGKGNRPPEYDFPDNDRGH